MDSKDLETQKAIVDLFNQYEFVQPKFSTFNKLINGRVLKQILAHIQDIPFDIDIEENEDFNWAICLKNLKDILTTLIKQFPDEDINIDVIKISKNQDMKELWHLVQWVLYAIIKSEKSQDLIQPMMNLPQDQQIQMAQLMNSLMNQTNVTKEKYQNSNQQEELRNDYTQQNQVVSEQFMKQLEELESENKNLRRTLKFNQQEADNQKNQLLQQMDIISKENEQLQKQITQKEYEMNEIYDKFSIQSSNELVQYMNGKEQEISSLQNQIKDMNLEIRHMKENQDDIIQRLRGDLDKQTKKSSLIPKLERQIEQVKQDFDVQKSKIQQEFEKEKQVIQKEILELQQKLKQSVDKHQKQKIQSKEEKTRISALEYDLQKLRAESTSQVRQITIKEQEIYQYQNEIAELENALDRVHQDNPQSLLEGTMTFTSPAKVANILSPKRNLGFELSQVMNRSQNALNWEQQDSWRHISKQDISRVNESLKNDDPEQILNVLSEENTIEGTRKPSSKFLNDSEDEDKQTLIDFWKSKCNSLLMEITEQEQKWKADQENQAHLELKVENFFKEQIKYKIELASTRDLMQKHFADNEGQNEQLASLKQQIQDFKEEKTNLLERINKLGSVELEQLNKIAKYESYLDELKKRREDRLQRKKVCSIQILEKQLKITKRSYEETLIQKNEEIQLLLSILIDLAPHQDSIRENTLYNKIQQNFNMPIMLSHPK